MRSSKMARTRAFLYVQLEERLAAASCMSASRELGCMLAVTVMAQVGVWERGRRAQDGEGSASLPLRYEFEHAKVCSGTHHREENTR